MDDFQVYSCLFKDVYVNFTQFSDNVLENLELECSWIAVIVAGILLSLALILVMTSIFCYRNRWNIRYACLKLTHQGQRYQHLVNEMVHYDCDAFVVYDSADGVDS